MYGKYNTVLLILNDLFERGILIYYYIHFDVAFWYSPVTQRVVSHLWT